MMKGQIDLIFYAFAVMIVLPLVYMIITKNVIRAAFAFGLSLLGLAAVYVLLNAEFMAVVQIMIYAGGILVLLIFGVMLTKRSSGQKLLTGHHLVIVGVLGTLALLGALVSAIFQSGLSYDPQDFEFDQVDKIGVLYLTDHLVAFELIAFLLLAALVGAAFMAKKSDQG